MKRVPSIIFASLLSACASDPRPDTRSGNLEITVSGARPECVRTVTSDAIASYGFRIKTTQADRIIAGRIPPGSADEERITVLFLPQHPSGALRIVVYGDLVTRPNTNFESSKPTSPSQFQQDKLDLVKQRIENSCGRRNG